MNGPAHPPRRHRSVGLVILATGLAVFGVWGIALLQARAPDVPLPTNAPPAATADLEAPETATDATTAPSALSAAKVPEKNPYLSVVTRNPFGLKDPPPPKAPEPEPKPETKPSALKLSGISTLLSGKQAMFVLQEPGKKNVYSGLVSEGDTDTMIAGLQVVSIDPKAGSVRVNYGGSELLLDFKNNGLKPPKAAVAKGRTASRTRVAGRTVTRPTTSGRTSVTRPGHTSSSTSGIRRVGSGSYTAPSVPRNYNVPSRTTRTSRGSAQRNQPRPLSPAEQVIIMRAQRAQAEASGIPMPPSPPIPGLDSPNAPPNPGILLPPTPGGR